MSWGHDEYLYHVVKDYLPKEALYMIRYHSFYPWHREGEYGYFMNAQDREMLKWVQAFNPYDLYTKSAQRPNLQGTAPLLRRSHQRIFPTRVAVVMANFSAP